MAEVIRMPKMSDTMEEGVIATWLVKEGDEVQSGDILAEVETDKATMELENYDDGTILYLAAQEKTAVPVDGIIAIIGEPGEEYQSLLDGDSGNSIGETAPEKESSQTEEAPQSKPAAETPKNSSLDVSSIPATIVRMPKMSDTMEEGVIAAWLVKEGDEVQTGDILAEVETDKATMELESYEDGTLLYIGAQAGNAVKVDGIIAIIGEAGADFQALLDAENAGGTNPSPSEEKPKEAATAPSEEKKEKPAPEAPAPTPAQSSSTPADGRIIASPLAKKMAEEKGYDLGSIKGSGENGRIIKRDVEEYTPQTAKAPAAEKAPASAAPAEKEEKSFIVPSAPVGEENYTEEGVSQMRKIIAKRLAESKFTAPHFYLTMEINMDKAIEARKSLNEIAPVKISFNDMVIKAVAAALRQHPKVNASWLGDKIRYNQHIHIGMAVAVDEGLLVPVIRFADSKSLSQISAEAKEFGKKARDKKLQPSDWEGNTFTISNLGMTGIEEFTAIINPPDACIMAVGGIKQTPIVKDGQIVPGNVMKVTLSCDHRVVDGMVGSAFLQTFKQFLEDPVRILI